MLRAVERCGAVVLLCYERWSGGGGVVSGGAVSGGAVVPAGAGSLTNSSEIVNQLWDTHNFLWRKQKLWRL